jgi:hypothetical protein
MLNGAVLAANTPQHERGEGRESGCKNQKWNVPIHYAAAPLRWVATTRLIAPLSR